MILDSSAILAILFNEPHAGWVLQQMKRATGALAMSTVNLTEVLIILQDRQPARFAELERTLLGSGIRFVAPDESQARVAAQARLRYPLNLGDCFAYALARSESGTILTLDSDFRNLDVSVMMP